ncbi:MAG: hypothetical protein V1792_12830 [Pseudomonadota bacterium]
MITRNTERLFWVSFLGWLILYAAWYLWSGAEMGEFQRHLALRGAKLLTMVPALIFSAFLFDLLTPGNWMEKVGESTDACAKVTIALIVAVAYCVR